MPKSEILTKPIQSFLVHPIPFQSNPIPRSVAKSPRPSEEVQEDALAPHRWCGAVDFGWGGHKQKFLLCCLGSLSAFSLGGGGKGTYTAKTLQEKYVYVVRACYSRIAASLPLSIYNTKIPTACQVYCV